MSALAASLLVVVAVTLFPAVTAKPGGDLNLIVGLGDSSPEDFAFNLILFVPLGVTAAATARTGTERRWIGIVAGASLLSYMLEVTQTLLPGRFPSLLDVAANTVGATAGLGGFYLWRAGRTVFLLVSAVVLAFAMSLLLARAGRLNWNSEYPLVLGNEQTGDRPWMGRLWYVALLDKAASVADLRDIMAQPATAKFALSRPGTGRVLALYDFTALEGCRDMTQHLGALISSDGRRCVADGEGIRVGQDRWLRASGSTASVSTSIRRTGQFTLVVRMASSSAHQVGPARIVSISASPDLRNLTLAQDNADFVVRVRTPLTGVNGVRVPLIGSDEVIPGRAQVVAVTYDGARLSLFVDGLQPAAAVDFGPGLALAAQIVPANVFSNVVRLVPIEKIYALLVFATLGSAAAWLLSQRGTLLVERVPLLFTGLLSTPLILETLLHVVSGGRLDWARIALGVAALLAAVGACRFFCRRYTGSAIAQERESNCL